MNLNLTVLDERVHSIMVHCVILELVFANDLICCTPHAICHFSLIIIGVRWDSNEWKICRKTFPLHVIKILSLSNFRDWDWSIILHQFIYRFWTFYPVYICFGLNCRGILINISFATLIRLSSLRMLFLQQQKTAQNHKLTCIHDRQCTNRGKFNISKTNHKSHFRQTNPFIPWVVSIWKQRILSTIQNEI